MENNTIYYSNFLETAFDNGNYATDDVIAFVIPLFEEVIGFHESNLVAPFENENTLFIMDNRIDIDETFAKKGSQAKSEIANLFVAIKSKNFDIVGKTMVETDIDEGTSKIKNLQVHFENTPLRFPAFIRGYNCFEITLGHHDPQTDIFCLGLILGSMALGLDLYDKDDVELFATYRTNPVQFNNRIHPTISMLITEMTELDRTKRSQDLYDIIYKLKNYRDYDPEKQMDLSNLAGWVNKDLSERSLFVLNKLRNRLFDTSRRNRLLFYKSNMRFVNLTVSSVPMVLHYQSIRPDLLFTWNNDVSAKIVGMKEIVLNKYLRFEDHSYLPAALDKIRVESQRDVQEYGFSQLKLVIAFLNWHNLKENINERIQSPLLLIPVELKKTKRLKEDHYVMKVQDNAAEVNPVLANQLRELYGIKLPDFVDLEEMKLEQFYAILKKQIDEANQGILLHYKNKPKIKLVHSIAKQTLTNYRKRIKRNGSQLESYKDISYSYLQEQYKPLGLEIFRQRIQHRASNLEFLINEDITIASQQLTGNNTKERELYEMSESESNPYSWDFDVCNIVLGNFNYKKMSLVRDYNNVIDSKIKHNVFEELFSTKPKQIKQHRFNLNKPEDWFHVIIADPTQTQAVLQSRSGDSYIIQGPPGTGKSQTITNLVADFVARGKRVLFVCEKRAALDVVFHRLKQNGLDELCCYIHDSQGDKRDFIKNLKNTYEDFSKNKFNFVEIESTRQQLFKQMNESLAILEVFHSTHISDPENAQVSVSNLLNRIIEIKENVIQLTPKQQELFPKYKNWIEFGDAIKNLSEALEESGADAAFAEHAMSKLNDEVLLDDNPTNAIDSLIQETKFLIEDIDKTLTECGIEIEQCEYLSQIKNLVQFATLLQPLALQDNLALLHSNSEKSKTFEKSIKNLSQLKNLTQKISEDNKSWVNKFSEQDVKAALEIANKNEGSFFGFLNNSWRKLKKQLDSSYQFSNHHLKPTYLSVLKTLQEEYTATHNANAARQEIEQAYEMENIDTTYLSIETLKNSLDKNELKYLLNHKNAKTVIENLFLSKDNLHKLNVKLSACLVDYENETIGTIKDDLENIAMNIDGLQELLPALKGYAAMPINVKNALRKFSLLPLQTEATMANTSLQSIFINSKSFANTDLQSIETAVSKIKQSYEQLLKLNADYIRANIRKRFLQNMEISNTALSQLNAEQKLFKKNYNEGRKILENEFGKSMRFKSIRELSAKESGLVLKDIKPVWLMSPLSVSDSLPIDTNYFDVVIFDEASQITLEEGIPALYRSTQTIIVGDDKQMPPTNFFSAKAEDPDDLDNLYGADNDELLSADADSLLVQGTRKLDSTMLSWHYRSHYETLISYSNHAFYDASLLTIPDKTIQHNEKAAIEILKPEDALENADALFDRSISFHYHPNSIYEKRNNIDEASYIANLVCTLLKRKIKESIGIVAFSQEQQNTIEDALTNLAASDKEFELLLEEAYNRTENDQFVGLIIKNLENIQGDERDIIIMSVCYGFDTRKKMFMNFGPINKKGGEKRLNVIFSRAKKHMAIISSIKHFNITNEYNEGANYFRRFLQYAENISLGNMQIARTILDGLVINKSNQLSENNSSVVLKQIKKQLESKGYQVTEQVGQSDFKCSLAVKLNANDIDYTLSILLDDEKHYTNKNLIEQYYQRPAILESFGWKTIHVFAKDWLLQPDKVIQQILKRLSKEPAKETFVEQIVQDNNLFENSIERIVEENTASLFIENPIIGFEDVLFERYIFSDSKSNKFWEVAVKEDKLIVRYGKVGTKGQPQIKTFLNKEKVEVEKQKLVREKLGKGYFQQ